MAGEPSTYVVELKRDEVIQIIEARLSKKEDQPMSKIILRPTSRRLTQPKGWHTAEK